MDSNNLKWRSEGSKSSKEYDIIGFAREEGHATYAVVRLMECSPDEYVTWSSFVLSVSFKSSNYYYTTYTGKYCSFRVFFRRSILLFVVNIQAIGWLGL